LAKHAKIFSYRLKESLGFIIALYFSEAKLQRNGLKPSQFGEQYRHQKKIAE